jgi:hypothetical protein
MIHIAPQKVYALEPKFFKATWLADITQMEVGLAAESTLDQHPEGTSKSTTHKLS